MSKDIDNINSKEQRHGYQEWYWNSGELWFKGFFHNDVQIGYQEFYYITRQLEKSFYI